MKRTIARRGLLESPFRLARLRRYFTTRPNPPCVHCGGATYKDGRRDGYRYFKCNACNRRHAPDKPRQMTPRITTPGQCPCCGAALWKDGTRRGRQKYECSRCHHWFTGEAVTPKPQPKPPHWKTKRARAEQARGLGDDLLMLVQQQVCRRAPPDLHDDLTQELALAALLGDVDPADLAASIPLYRTRITRLSSTTAKFVPLDAPLPSTNGLTYAETLIG